MTSCQPSEVLKRRRAGSTGQSSHSLDARNGRWNRPYSLEDLGRLSLRQRC